MIPTKSDGAAAWDAGAQASTSAQASMDVSRAKADKRFPLLVSRSYYGIHRGAPHHPLRPDSRLARKPTLQVPYSA